MKSLIPTLSLVFLLSMTFYHLGEARTIIVGGSVHGWKIPEPSNNTLNHWAESQRFRIGDVLEFYYDSKNDSVLQVTKENYESCNTEKPLKEYKHENTNVKLDGSGPHYFISGANGNCGKGEKLIVVVQSPNHPPIPKPGPGASPTTPSSNPPTSPAAPATPSSKPPTPPVAPAPAPANNTAVGLVAGSGIFWAFVALIGLAWA